MIFWPMKKTENATFAEKLDVPHGVLDSCLLLRVRSISELNQGQDLSMHVHGRLSGAGRPLFMSSSNGFILLLLDKLCSATRWAAGRCLLMSSGSKRGDMSIVDSRI
jgi:hypothetical protein